ncbi:hypothetical protein OC844_007550, partial [Tilletia horrida]
SYEPSDESTSSSPLHPLGTSSLSLLGTAARASAGAAARVATASPPATSSSPSSPFAAAAYQRTSAEPGPGPSSAAYHATYQRTNAEPSPGPSSAAYYANYQGTNAEPGPGPSSAAYHANYQRTNAEPGHGPSSSAHQRTSAGTFSAAAGDGNVVASRLFVNRLLMSANEDTARSKARVRRIISTSSRGDSKTRHGRWIALKDVTSGQSLARRRLSRVAASTVEMTELLRYMNELESRSAALAVELAGAQEEVSDLHARMDDLEAQ